MVKFGVQIENHAGYSYEAVSRVAAEAERLGFDGLFICDHLVGRTEELAKQTCLDTWVTLGALASATRRIRLGTLVSAVGFRYPSILAKMAATLDAASQGRLQFAIGAGWYQPEYAAYGVPFPSTKKRMDQLREAIQIIREMWTQNKPTFNGVHYNIKEASCNPKPVQPSIWVGGTGEKRLLRVVAELADGWNASYITAEEYDQKLKTLQSYCNAAGRDIGKIERSYFASGLTAKTDAEFRETFARYYAPFKREDETIDDFAQRARTSSRTFAGTVDEVVEKVAMFQRLGVTYVIFYFPDKDQLGLMRKFAEHVLPQFRDV